MAKIACDYAVQDLDAGTVEAWLKFEMAKLKLAARDLVEAYFREGREKTYSRKVWPRMKEYNGTFYVIWCRKEYVNPKRGVVRTQHISRGQVSYRQRLTQVCRHLEAEEKSFVLWYEDRFQELRRLSELLAGMLSQLERYQRLQKKDVKKVLFGPDGGGGTC